MVTGTGRLRYPDTIQLAGRTLRLARDTDPRSGLHTGPRLWRVETAVPQDAAQEADRFRALVTAGHFGMGGSVKTGYRQLHDYSLDCDVESWGYLGPGPYGTYMGLGLSAQVIDLEVVRDANGNRYLYVATQGNVLKKVRISQGGPTALVPVLAAGVTATVDETKTFTHGDGGAASAVLTDIQMVHDGELPTIPAGSIFAGRYTRPAIPPTGVMLVGFGTTAGLQQLDVVGILGAADTWGTLAASGERAYAGVFANALGPNNLVSLTWKSTGNTTQNTGAFSRIQSTAAVFGANLTSVLSWQPNTGLTMSTLDAYMAGLEGTSITSLTQHQRGLVAGKPEGVYAFDQTYNSYSIFATENYRHDENARHMTAWGHQLLVPTAQDLMVLPPRTDAAAGPSTLPSVAGNPVQGVTTAVATYGKYAFIAVYDGLDSYIVRLRRRLAEPVPHEFLHYPFARLPGTRCAALRVFDDGTGREYLAAAVQTGVGAYDVKWWMLDPVRTRRYQTGGVWFSERAGTFDAKTVIERVSVGGVGFAPGDQWAVSVVWDDGAPALIGTVAGNGAAPLVLAPGVNDSGYRYQLKAECTLASPTSNPRLAAGDDGALLVVEGFTQPDQLDHLVFTVEAGEGVEGDHHSRIMENGWQTWWWAKGLEKGTHPLVAEAYFGDVDGHMVAVEKVGYREGPQGEGDVPVIYVDFACRLLLGTTPGGGT